MTKDFDETENVELNEIDETDEITDEDILYLENEFDDDEDLDELDDDEDLDELDDEEFEEEEDEDEDD